jgi:hypothetical protein
MIIAPPRFLDVGIKPLKGDGNPANVLPQSNGENKKLRGDGVGNFPATLGEARHAEP